MRRHVNQMAQSRLQVAKPIGRLGRILGMRRSLDGMNIEVQCQRMPRRLGHNSFQRRDDLFRPRLRFAGRQPQIPGRRSISDSANRLPISASSGYFCQTFRIAAA